MALVSNVFHILCQYASIIGSREGCTSFPTGAYLSVSYGFPSLSVSPWCPFFSMFCAYLR